MSMTDQYAGPSSAGLGRVIQDFGICNVGGEYLYTAKLRGRGFLVVTFFSLYSSPSVHVLESIRSWQEPQTESKLSLLAITQGNKDDVLAFAEQYKLENLPIALDHEWYNTRRWGVSIFPSTYIVEGKTGRVITSVIGDHPSALNDAGQVLKNRIAASMASDQLAQSTKPV